jgi:hypothetical protein
VFVCDGSLTGLGSDGLATTATLAEHHTRISYPEIQPSKGDTPCPNSLGGDDDPAFAVLGTITQTLRGETSKHGRVDRTDTGASEESGCCLPIRGGRKLIRRQALGLFVTVDATRSHQVIGR